MAGYVVFHEGSVVARGDWEDRDDCRGAELKHAKQVMAGMLGLMLSFSMTNPAAAASKAAETATPTASTDGISPILSNSRLGGKMPRRIFRSSGDKLIFQSTNNWMKDTFAAAMHPGRPSPGLLPNVCDGSREREDPDGQHRVRHHDLRLFLSPVIGASCTRRLIYEAPIVLESLKARGRLPVGAGRL